MIVKSLAIILHRFPYSDSSFIVKALTEECGIISFIIKGGKKKESPFRGALDPLDLSEIVFQQNPNTELQFIKEATLLDWRKNLRLDLLCLAKAQVMVEMIMRYAPQGVPLLEEFKRLEQAISDLDKACISSITSTNTSSKSNIFAQWLLDTCDMWGYDLDLGTCCRCEKTLEKPAADFFHETGGLLCQSCLGVDSPRTRTETLKGLWALHTGQSIENPEFTENALLTYLRRHIGFLKEIHSIKFLNETRKLYNPFKEPPSKALH